ncbi:MAG: hypothetical protein ACRDCE_17970 [Cetobacterium sp.]|uniref:hypothetical protein n=1 Tax=Cetobacterium sp. TaxID=2071632 RepID=UPI003EE626D2
MNKHTLIENTGNITLFSSTFPFTNGKTLTCFTRNSGVAERLELSEVMVRNDFPLTPCLRWAQSGELKYIIPFLEAHSHNNSSAIVERADYISILIEAGYTYHSVLDWAMFGEKDILKKNEVVA